jgi:hypothetical protein
MGYKHKGNFYIEKNMKKLIGILGLFGIAVMGYSQVITTITWPAGTKCTNLLSYATRVYTVSIDAGASLDSTNHTLYVYDTPRVNIGPPGWYYTNTVYYSNGGYATYSQAFSNMNWGMPGSVARAGINSFTNPNGAVTLVSNEASLSNMLVTLSNWTGGAITTRPLKATATVLSNAVNTFDFGDGLWFGQGITITNPAALNYSRTITITHAPAL